MPSEDFHRVGSLEIDEDLPFQRFEWALERLGWLMLSAFLGAAAWGVFGSHPKSLRVTNGPSASLWVEYDRYPRWNTETKLTVHARPTEGASTVGLAMDSDTLEKIEWDRLVPTPLAITPTAERTTFIFASGPGPDIVVELLFKPKAPGLLRPTVQLDNSEPVTFRQFVYP